MYINIEYIGIVVYRISNYLHSWMRIAVPWSQTNFIFFCFFRIIFFFKLLCFFSLYLIIINFFYSSVFFSNYYFYNILYFIFHNFYIFFSNSRIGFFSVCGCRCRLLWECNANADATMWYIHRNTNKLFKSMQDNIY